MFEEREICIDKNLEVLEAKAEELMYETAKLHGRIFHMELDSISELNNEWVKRIDDVLNEAKDVDQKCYLLHSKIERLKRKRSFKARLPKLFKKS